LVHAVQISDQTVLVGAFIMSEGDNQLNSNVPNGPLRLRLIQLEEEIHRLNLKIRAMETSRSWRITAPLRKITTSLRRRGILPDIISFVSNSAIENYFWRTTGDLTFSKPSVTVVAHVFYTNLANEIAATAARCRVGDRVIVTFTETEALESMRAIFKSHGLENVQFVHVANRGRDFLPFLTCIHQGLLEDADFVLKIHTKKSLHLPNAEGDLWRRSLLEGLAPHSSSVSALIDDLSRRPDVAWACPAQWIAGNESWGSNKKRVSQLLTRIGLRRPRRLVFPAGSMLWMSRDVVDALHSLQLGSDDFENDDSLDGALGHALERFIGSWTLATRRTVWRLRN
jgi:lipopolysaccharide biosynthesis protein